MGEKQIFDNAVTELYDLFVDFQHIYCIVFYQNGKIPLSEMKNIHSKFCL